MLACALPSNRKRKAAAKPLADLCSATASTAKPRKPRAKARAAKSKGPPTTPRARARSAASGPPGTRAKYLREQQLKKKASGPPKPRAKARPAVSRAPGTVKYPALPAKRKTARAGSTAAAKSALPAPPWPAEKQRASVPARRITLPVWYGSDCSGLDAAAIGLQRLTRFRHWFASEKDDAHRAIFKSFHPECQHVYADAAGKDLQRLKAERAQHPSNLFVYCAGFCCEPFSKQGKRLGGEDARAAVIWPILKTIHMLVPDVWILENVPDLMTAERHRKHFLDIIRAAGLVAQGCYYIDFRVLDSYTCGSVPATRRRLYIVGVRKDTLKHQWQWPGQRPPVPLESILQTGLPRVPTSSLTLTNIRNLAQAMQKLKAADTNFMHKPWIVDLQASPGFSAAPTLGRLPTVTKSHASSLWLISQQRYLTVTELLASQGIRVASLRCNVDNLPQAVLARMAGNAQTATVLERLWEALLRAVGGL